MTQPAEEQPSAAVSGASLTVAGAFAGMAEVAAAPVWFPGLRCHAPAEIRNGCGYRSPKSLRATSAEHGSGVLVHCLQRLLLWLRPGSL